MYSPLSFDFIDTFVENTNGIYIEGMSINGTKIDNCTLVAGE